MATIKLCFFASLSETLGIREEIFELNRDITLSELKKSLAERDQHWQALNDPSILCAINHEMVTGDPMLKTADEVAFFPPVTGG